MRIFSRTDLEELYQRLRQSGPEESFAPPTIQQFATHPASTVRSRAACGRVMSRWARHVDLRDDVLQEAIYTINRRLAAGRLRFTGAGPDQFGRWLWSVWYRACSNAWRRCRPIWLRNVQLVDASSLECAGLIEKESAFQDRVEQAIEDVDDPELRNVLRDLRAGLTVRESADRWGVSKSTVSRLRQSGLESVRERLRREQPARTHEDGDVAVGEKR